MELTAYWEGWFDAQKFEPLFDDADPEYARGWRSWWAFVEFFTTDAPDVKSQVDRISSHDEKRLQLSPAPPHGPAG